MTQDELEKAVTESRLKLKEVEENFANVVAALQQDKTRIEQELTKKIQTLDRQVADLKQESQNLFAEIFLDEATAMFPDRTIRNRKTMRGTLNAVVKVINGKGHIISLH